MAVHFAVQYARKILGKGTHQLRVARLDHAQREHLGIVKQIEVVLQHIEAELFLVQRAVADADHEGVVQTLFPIRRRRLVKNLRNLLHLAYSSRIYALLRSKRWFIGPLPLPRSSMAANAPEM